MDIGISLLAQKILFFSILNSIVTYGFLMTIRSVMAKADQDPNEVVLPKFVGVILTYSLGIVMGFMINHHKWWEDILYGLSIGSCSVAIYKSAIQSFLNLIPSIFDKIFSAKKEEKE